MLKNYITIALRNLWRNRLYTILNVAGLAIGISACLVIYLIVSFELSFDTFHPDKDRIYRVHSRFSGTFEGTNSGVPVPLPFTLRSEVTGIETVAAFYTLYMTKVSVERASKEKKVFKDVKGIMATEPQYFEVFKSYEWLAGSPETSLTAPFQVVLTESKAKTYFGITKAQEALGKFIHYNDSLTVTVSGIVKDLPQPTDLIFTDFLSFSTIKQSWLKNNAYLDAWDNFNSASQTFIKLLPEAKPDQIKPQLRQIVKKYATDEKNPDWKNHFHLQALSQLHFNPNLGIFSDSRSAANLPTLHILIAIALLLLLIASINFINLVTAQAVKRSKEVGVRKVLGSTRRELVFQFLSETFVITTFAVFLSIFLSNIALSYFKEFIPAGVQLRLFEPSTLLFLLAIIVVVSFLSGLYPAFVLSSFAPVFALKSQVYTAAGSGTAILRKGLIIFQFAFAQVLIVGTFIIGSQIDFMLAKDMGFDKDAVVIFSTPWEAKDNRNVLKQELHNMPGITALSMHAVPPAMGGRSSTIITYDNGKEIVKHDVDRKFGDTTFIHLYNIPLIAGRNILESDTIKEYVINETYARLLGFKQPEQALGKMLDKKFPIVGIVKDFHVQSLHNAIPPVVIASDPDNSRYFSLKLSTQGKGMQDFQATMEQVRKVWNPLYPGNDFRYTFLDENITRFYEAEQRTNKLTSTATGIAILISCLGLFGLATYTAEQRTKEIGIRKVLGASVSNITLLLSKDFFKLMLLAFAIGSPVAWYVMHEWLKDFAYQTKITPWVFVIAGILALLIAIITVSYQSIKAALMNPVKSLRNE